MQEGVLLLDSIILSFGVAPALPLYILSTLPKAKQGLPR